MVPLQFVPSKHFLFSKTSWRRLEEVFSVTILHLPRRLQDVFARPLPKMSSRLLQDAFKTSSQGVFKTFSRRLRLERQKIVTLKTSSRRLQYVFIKTNACWVKTANCRLVVAWKYLLKHSCFFFTLRSSKDQSCCKLWFHCNKPKNDYLHR